MSDNFVKKKVLVVDDSSFMRNVIVRFLESDGRFEIVGSAQDGAEAVEKCCQLQPDVVTLDVEMPKMNGLEALKRIMSKCPTRVVMVSSLTEAGAKETMLALEFGAIDFIPKAMEDKGRSVFSNTKMLRDKIYAASLATVANINTVEATIPAAMQAPLAKAVSQPASLLRFKKAEIVLIGVSTGGPKALHEIMPEFMNDLRVPIVIVQHMPPNFTGAMASRLNEISSLTVSEGQDGDILHPGHVYISPGGMQCRVIRRGDDLVFSSKKDKNESLYKPSVDVMSESIYSAVGGNVIAVMMTGMGSDGSQGFDKLKKAGAYVIAQSEETCVVYGMPKVVVDKGLHNEVLPLGQIPSTVERLLA